MTSIKFTDLELDNLLSILNSLHYRPTLLDSIEAQLAPVEAPVGEDPAPKKSKTKADPVAE